jgi:hypothetical protein
LNQPKVISIQAPEDDNGKKRPGYESQFVYISFISDRGSYLEITYLDENSDKNATNDKKRATFLN